jgi:hypothetical protein
MTVRSFHEALRHFSLRIAHGDDTVWHEAVFHKKKT